MGKFGKDLILILIAAFGVVIVLIWLLGHFI
jgi:hypothetical protein